MIEKPEQYYDTRRHQLYYQWRESEHFSHQEPIYDRTRDYIESLEAENAKLWELVRKVLQFERAGCDGCPYASICDVDCLYEPDCPMREDIERDMRELGVEVDE